MEGWNVLFWSLYAALTALALMPIQLTDLLPLRDAPLHLHMATAWAAWPDSAWLQATYLRPDGLVPGVLWYQLADWLAGIGGIEWAARLLLSLSVALLPLSALHLLRAIGHSRWLVLGVFAWSLSGDFFAGALPWLLALPLLLWLLAAHIALHRRPGLGRAMGVSVLFALVVLAHPLAGLVAACLLPVVGAVAGARNGWRRALLWPLREAIVCLPALILVMPWVGDTLLRLRTGVDANHLTPMGAMAQLFSRMFSQFSATSGEIGGLPELLLQRPGELVSGLWLFGYGLWLVAALRGDDRPLDLGASVTASPAAPSDAAADQAPRVDGSAWMRWTLATAAAVYLVLPQQIRGPAIGAEISPHLVVLLAVLAVLALPLRPLRADARVRWRARLGAACLILAAVIMSLQTTGTFLLARTGYGSLRAAYGAIPSQRRVLTLRSSRGSPWLRQPVFDHLGAYYPIVQGGRVAEGFAAIWPRLLEPRKPSQLLPSPSHDDHGRFTLRQHGRFYDYLVLHRVAGERPGEWERTLRSWPAIYQRDRWRVLQNPSVEKWPEPTREEVLRSRRIERMVEMALRWPGLGPEDDPAISAHSWLKLLGLDLPDPPPMPAHVPTPELDRAVAIPALDRLPDFDAPSAPESATATLRPLLGPEFLAPPRVNFRPPAGPQPTH